MITRPETLSNLSYQRLTLPTVIAKLILYCDSSAFVSPIARLFIFTDIRATLASECVVVKLARMEGRGEVFSGFWLGRPKGRDHWED